MTPLGPDVLLLVGFSGREALSQLFHFQLDVLAENNVDVSFDRLLGQKVTIGLNLPAGDKRYFSGICNRVCESRRDATFTAYQLEIVPQFWLLTRKAESRIFQQASVPDILKTVLSGLDVTFEIQGVFHPRDYCVQYRETSFSFASRLMEEEGIFYFFKHSENGHTMVVANTPQSHPDLPGGGKVLWEGASGGLREEDRVHHWDKTQELRSGKYVLWDHTFELPHKHLEADQPIADEIAIGKVKHKFKLGANESLEIYDYPGEYAQRFDGVAPGGGDRSSDLQKIFEDNKRTVGIRMQQEAVPGVIVDGQSDCRRFVTGHKFTLLRHHNADGLYLLTGIDHRAALEGNYRSGGQQLEMLYENQFTCIPFGLPFRPLRLTPKPHISGTQTAVVVGPPGEEIFPDKYGRVQVLFHWDREAQNSCWIRVGTPIAGRQWGMINIPRIGHEVIVAFEEGDPDRPIIVGSVYNADQMPSYLLPDHKVLSGFKSYSTPGGGGFNELRFDDTKDKEQIFLHGQYDMDVRIKNDSREWIGRDRHLVVQRDKRQEVGRDEHIFTKRDLVSHVGRDRFLKVSGKEAILVEASRSVQVDGNVAEKFGKNHTEEAALDIYLKAGKNIVLEAGAQISLKVGGNFVDVSPAGVAINGTMILLNSGGAPAVGISGSLVPPAAPAVAEIADQADPGSKAESYRTQRAALSSEQLAALDAPTHDPSAGENRNKPHWIEIELLDEKDKPVPGEPYRITLPDGTVLAEGALDEKGFARVDGIDPGTCRVTFPRLDKDTWKPK
jgi:type VI secretion system secreted protein VgrG